MYKTMHMSILKIIEQYNDENSCRLKLRSTREKQGLTCGKCGHNKHYWKKDKQCWECKQCHFRISLTSGTIMHKTKLPLRYWFIAIGMLTSLKKGISAKELQRQLGHKRYEPIFSMLHKIRIAMGKRDELYELSELMELDHAYFTASSSNEKIPEDDSSDDEGNGKQKVMVMAQVKEVEHESASKHRPNKKVSFIKMIHVDDIKTQSVNYYAQKHISKDSTVVTDNHKSYKKLIDVVKEHFAIQCYDRSVSSEVLPWVHIAISNAKRWLLGVHHNVKPEYFQNYLNEFCYKFNRRYFGDRLMDRALIAAVSCRWDQ